MGRIVKEGQTFRRWDVTEDEARAELRDEPYKLELIGLKGDPAGGRRRVASRSALGELTIYENVRGAGRESEQVVWQDLCRGPHVPSTRLLGNGFQLTRSAAAYWRGSREEPAAAARLRHRVADQGRAARLPRAPRRGRAPRPPPARHRAGPVLLPRRDRLRAWPCSTPRAASSAWRWRTTRRLRHVRGRVRVRQHPAHHQGQAVRDLGAPRLVRGGHVPPDAPRRGARRRGHVRKAGQHYYLKPMNCPMHNLIFAARGRSYRELPLRLFEFGTVYRYEKSGVVHGMTRARGFTQDDAHIYCTREQMADELTTTAQLRARPAQGLRARRLLPGAVDQEPGEVRRLRRGLGGGHRDAARRSREASGLDLVPDPGGAAFYGPKISVQVKDAIGRTWQMSTIQLDFNLPERFELEYTASDGSRQRPGDDPPRAVRLDRAVLRRAHRALRRRVPGLARAGPGARRAGRRAVRAATSTTSSRQLRAQGIRAEVDRSDDRFGKKIRNASTQKIPFVLIAGGEDAEAGAVSFRYRDGRQDNGVPVGGGDRADRRGGARPRAGLTVADTESADDLAGVPDGFERLWTPHRMAYIGGQDKPTDREAGAGCPFCRIPTLSDEDGLIVARGEVALRRAQPLPVQLGAPAGLPVPARRRLHGPDGGRRSPRSPR